jgi:predicted GNAT family acetyltransferase
MPNFFQTAEKFLGFAGKEAAEVIDKSALAFSASGPAWERTISLHHGKEFVGSFAYKVDTKGTAMVSGTEVLKKFRGQHFGKQLHIKAIEDAAMGGAKVFSSDQTGSSLSHSHVWNSLMKDYSIEKFTHSTGKEGWRMGLAGVAVNEADRSSVVQVAANRVKKAIVIQQAAGTTKMVMESGTGHSLAVNRRFGAKGRNKTNAAL